MNGTAEWLEIVLFLLGIIFVCMEVFVLPGFGIFGLGGGAMVLISLVLATQTFVLPTNEYQMERLASSMLSVFGALVGVGVAGYLLRRYLPSVPVLGRMMLNPPASEEIQRREAIVDYSHLLGQSGTTKTRLSPSGKAMFGDELIDVISQGELVRQDASNRCDRSLGKSGCSGTGELAPCLSSIGRPSCCSPHSSCWDWNLWCHPAELSVCSPS